MTIFCRKWVAMLAACVLALLTAAGAVSEEAATMTDLPGDPGLNQTEEAAGETMEETPAEPVGETAEEPVSETGADSFPWRSETELAEQGYQQAAVISAGGAPVYAAADEQAEVAARLETGTAVWVKEADGGFFAAQAGTEADPVTGYIRAEDIALYLAEEPEEEPVLRSIAVTSTLTGMEYVSVGTEIELKAELYGFLDTDRYTLQWQYSPDGGVTVVDVEGGNEPVYRYIMDEKTFTYSWRLVVTLLPAEETAEADD